MMAFFKLDFLDNYNDVAGIRNYMLIHGKLTSSRFVGRRGLLAAQQGLASLERQYSLTRWTTWGDLESPCKILQD